MISGLQIRAARGLLDLSADELGKGVGLRRAAIHKLESGAVQPRAKNLADIVKFLEESGVEFIGERGVALRQENYRLLEGHDCYLRLLDEVYQSLRGKPAAEVLSICTDDDLSPPEVVTALQRWHKAGIKCRFLSHEKATRFDFPLEEYRLIPHRFFRVSVMVVFENKVATVRLAGDAILVVNDKDQADMLRGLFNLIWEKSAKPVPAILGKTGSNKKKENNS